MSRLTDLIGQLKKSNNQLAVELEKEVKVLSSRREFGLNFERHKPEVVELPLRKVRKGDKVKILPDRGTIKKTEEDLWLVKKVFKRKKVEVAVLKPISVPSSEELEVLIENLIVVAEFRDAIYPGLVSTGKINNDVNKPFHTVINGENYHALKALTFTHKGKVDLIYIDPPYNTGAKDWKYNNNYVEGEDLYRHSKWLAFMERRLVVAERLLNPNESVLIVTIDEKEYLRLGLLLEQLFPEATIQMISSAINPKGSSRSGFRRTDEYLFFVMFGSAKPARMELDAEWASSAKAIDTSQNNEKPTEPDWTSMMRRGSNAARADRPNMFYPIYVDPELKKIVDIGEPIPEGKHKAEKKKGLVTVLPIRSNGEEGRWQVSGPELQSRIEQGRVRLGRATSYGFVINYLPDGAYSAVLSDRFEINGRAEDGSLIAIGRSDTTRVAPTQWKISSHNASEHGSTLLSNFLPKRQFPFPKSLYAVEDALRFFIINKANAIVLDFFSGSGTTAHAVMRLNKQDGGKRQCISITNNEVSADELTKLRRKGLRPGDPDWEKWGICEYITKPRIKAAISGKTPTGKKIKGEYKFTDSFPYSEGFKENVEFFNLTYESLISVSHNLAFKRISPLLWMYTGSQGKRIDVVPKEGWEIVENYGVLIDLDKTSAFCKVIRKSKSIKTVFIFTNDERRYQSIAKKVPAEVECVRLYENYLKNFRFTSGE